MKIISVLLRGGGIVEKGLGIIIIGIIFITAMPIYSEIIETSKFTKLFTISLNISRAATKNNVSSCGGEIIEMEYGFPTALSITNIVDLSDFDVSYNLDYIDIRVYEEDELFLRYFPSENGISLNIYTSDQIEDYSM